MLTPYIFLLFVYVVFWEISHQFYRSGISQESSNKLFLTLCGIYLILFIGFRATYVGDDTIWYKYYFTQETAHDFFDFSDYTASKFEIGYRLLTKIIALFTNNTQIYLIIISAITISVWMRAISLLESDHPFQTLLYGTLFIQSSFYYYMNVIRQGIANGIIAIALYYLFRKKNKKFIALIILAATFHSFAVIFLPLILIDRIKATKSNFIKLNVAILIGLSILSKIALVITTRFFPRYVYYFATDYNSHQTIGPRAFLLLLVGVILIMLNYYVIYRNEDENNNRVALYYGTIITLGTTLLFNMQNFGILERCARYYNYFFMYSIPFVFDNLAIENNARICRFGLFLMAFAFYCYNLATYYNGLTPYTMFFME